VFIRNVGTHQSDYTVTEPRRSGYEVSPPWVPRIKNKVVGLFVCQRYKFDAFAVATMGITSALRSLGIECSVFGERHLAECAA